MSERQNNYEKSAVSEEVTGAFPSLAEEEKIMGQGVFLHSSTVFHNIPSKAASSSSQSLPGAGDVRIWTWVQQSHLPGDAELSCGPRAGGEGQRVVAGGAV